MIAPVDVTNIRIETDRLILRPWQESDVEDFYEYAKVDGVGQMCGWLPHQDLAESQTILKMFMEHKKTLALELKENGKVIGSIGLEEREDELDIPEDQMGRGIGYVLSKDYWGRGLMPEAVKAVIDYCFYQLKFHWLTCGHFLRNGQSRRVVEKCGFRYVRDCVHHTRFGTEEPMKLYILHNPRYMTAPIDVTGVTLETERLLLRPWQEGDLEDFHAYASDPMVAPGMGWKRMESLEESRKLFADYMETKESFAIVLKETGRVIGDLSIQARYWEMYPLDRTLKGREFGFGIRSEYWGRGLMPEAVRAVTAYCFHKLHYDFITAGHFLTNPQSRRVIEKCGFTHLFDAPHTLPNGKTFDISTYIYYNPHKER